MIEFDNVLPNSKHLVKLPKRQRIRRFKDLNRKHLS